MSDAEEVNKNEEWIKMEKEKGKAGRLWYFQYTFSCRCVDLSVNW
jgi:hypothetical protein